MLLVISCALTCSAAASNYLDTLRGLLNLHAVSLLGRAQLLGRAEDPRQFVRHGKKEGFTEITLSGGAGERPVKVYHLIRSEGDRVSEWKLNGELCSFLWLCRPALSLLLMTIVCRCLAHAGHVFSACASCRQEAAAEKAQSLLVCKSIPREFAACIMA